MYFPLRVHGHHSLLTGVDSPATLVARARELGLSGIALADVDTLAGLVDFLHAAARVAAKPEHEESRRAASSTRATDAARSTARFHAIVAAEISDPSGEPGRLVALVEDEQGYKNLCKLVSARALGADPGVPGARLDGPESFRLVESAVRHQAGLTFLVDHPRLLVRLAGRVDPRALFAAISPAALRRGAARLSAFEGDGTRNAHLAPRARPLSASRGSASCEADDEEARREGDEAALESPKVPPPSRAVSALELVEAARAVGVATLAVPDVYCALASGLADHRLRVAIKHNALSCDLPAGWVAEAPAHLLGAAEMRALYADLPEASGPFERGSRGTSRASPGAVERTLMVAARCRYVPPLGGTLLPTIELAAGETAYSALCGAAFAGAQRRYRPLRPEVLRRLDYELSTIDRLGFAPYFLLVKQIADFARASGIPSVGRGSAADSLVAYCLALTDADPLRYKLIFERFLNPTRSDRPDIDLDFCWRRRDEVLDHVYALFGPERTAMISTLNRCGLRSAFREAALVEGLPPAEVNRWSRRLPHYLPAPSASAFDGESEVAFEPTEIASVASCESSALAPALRENPIALALFATPEARGFPFDDVRWQRVLRAAANLLDAPRHFGLHPGGVVVAPGPITDFVPCHRAAKGVIVTQLDKDAVEAIGLVKMDLLGNRALTVIDDCVRELAAGGIAIDLERLSEDDARTAATLREGRTLGCFQVESPGMRNLLKQTGACTMDDVIQAVALIRPGPAGSGMKDAYVRRFRKLESPAPPHPRLADLLWDTHGVMLYQEDVMQVAACIAGMELAEADLLRRALQKREAHKLGQLCDRFIAGAAEQGVAREAALTVWDLVANFASFGFCKAHAVTYGRIAYRAVWLKTHHPAVFLAAFLASETGYYDPRVYVEEARRLGIAILAPDVNRSGRTFRVEYGAGSARDERDRGQPGDRACGEVRETPRPSRADGSGTLAKHGAGRGRIAERGTPALRIGLGQVKGLSERTLAASIETRETRGPFVSLPDFLERTAAHTDEVEHLIQCGAFDLFDRTRPELLWRLHLLRTPARKLPRTSRASAGDDDEPLDPAQLAACRSTPRTRSDALLRAARARIGGWHARGLGLGNLELGSGESALLFPEPEAPALALPRLPDVDPVLRGRIEHELLGFSVHAHPVALFPCPGDERIALALRAQEEHERGALESIAAEGARVFESLGRADGSRGFRVLRPVNPTPCAELDRYEGARITLRGWPAATRHVRTEDGRTMRFLTLEDESGIAEVVLFPDVYERDGAHLAEFGTLCVTGIVENQMGACTLHAERVW